MKKMLLFGYQTILALQIQCLFAILALQQYVHVTYRILWLTKLQLYFVSMVHLAVCVFYLHLIIDMTVVVKQLKLIKVIYKTVLYGTVTVILHTKLVFLNFEIKIK